MLLNLQLVVLDANCQGNLILVYLNIIIRCLCVGFLQECPSGKEFPLLPQQKTNNIMIDNLLYNSSKNHQTQEAGQVHISPTEDPSPS